MLFKGAVSVEFTMGGERGELRSETCKVIGQRVDDQE